MSHLLWWRSCYFAYGLLDHFLLQMSIWDGRRIHERREMPCFGWGGEEGGLERRHGCHCVLIVEKRLRGAWICFDVAERSKRKPKACNLVMDESFKAFLWLLREKCSFGAGAFCMENIGRIEVWRCGTWSFLGLFPMRAWVWSFPSKKHSYFHAWN